jgi:hypothetical protein
VLSALERHTQGIEGVFLAASLCRHVNVYGFNADSLPGYPYHYYDDFRGDPHAHAFEFQALFLQMLEQQGLITLCGPGRHAPWCRFHTCPVCQQELQRMQPMPIDSLRPTTRIRIARTARRDNLL